MHGEDVFNTDIPHKPWPTSQEIDATASYAWYINANTALKGIFEAFLFASTDNFKVSQALGVDTDEIGFYREIFFDTAVFRNDLECMSWLQTVSDESSSKELLKMAYHQGFEALQWTYCRNKGEISADDAERTVLTDSFVQYLSHRGKPLNGKTAKEARNLSKVILESVKTIRSRTEMGDQNSAQSLRFKFKQAGNTKTVDELKGKGIEVLH